MSEQKPGLLGRLFGRRGPEPDPARPDPSASRSEGAPDFAGAAAAGEIAPVEPTVTQASPDLDEKLPAELAGADLQPVETVDPEGGAPLEPIPRSEPERGIGLTAPIAPSAPAKPGSPEPKGPEPKDPEPKGWWRRLSEGMRRTPRP
jgi:fused signal recognition particle receptor